MQEMEMTQPTSSNKNMMMIGGLLALVLVIGAGVLLTRQGNDVAPATSPTPVASPANRPAPTTDAVTGDDAAGMTSPAPSASAATNDEVRTINLEAGSFYYKPDVIKVKKGETVKIVMTSKDMMHDFNIDELDVKLPITRSGETNTVEFTATDTGTFEYYCSVGAHRANGQVGTLIVE